MENKANDFILITGRVVSEPVTRETTKGPVCNTRIAVEQFSKENKEKTVDFLGISGFDERGEAIAELKKGDRVTVMGKLKFRDWTDKTGKENTDAEITISRLLTVDFPAVEQAGAPKPTKRKSVSIAAEDALF